MKQQFKKLFNSPFSTIADFLNQVLYPIFGEQNFTPGYDILTNDPEIKERATCAHIEQIIHTGTFSTDLAADIKLFEVIVSDPCQLERSRINIQQLIRSYVDTFEGAFMVFHYQQPENRSWRFSYVEKRTSTTDSTSAKRYTYLLGTNQACRTAFERFYQLYQLQHNISLSDITTAFSVEALSDEFFDRYRELYADFVQYISGKRYEKIKGKWTEVIKHAPDPQFQTAFSSHDKTVRDYVKKMLGRLVFLQFLQRKGWLGVPAEKPWGQGDSNYMQHLFADSPHQDNFLEQVLEPLFFDTLNSQRPDQTANPILGNNIKIPFLNGGLFEKDDIDERVVVFPKDYFQQLFDFFGEYNFTIDENDPNDATIGIDPEMLGRIFENLLEDNKDKGAFYTPKEIVQYMCQQSLIEYLSTHHQEATDQIKQLILHHRADTLSDDLKQALAQQLHDIKVCDPAIGSGAFPMGILNELFKCRTALESNTQTAVELKKHIIQNNIYGVDIEQGAIDIARLRFWLSLVVDETEPQPLPNLDYKIMQGNSLLESYAGYDLSQLTTQKKDTVANATLTIFDDQLDILRRKLSDKIAQYFSCNSHTQKQQLKTDITNNILQQIKADNISIDLTDIDLAANDRFFLWHTFFADVFQRGGFDIVIGNPPYGVSIKEEYRKRIETYLGKVPDYEIYYYFIEVAKILLKDNSVLSYIIPNTYLFNTYAAKYRIKLLEEWDMCEILDCTKFPIFETATVFNTINTWKLGPSSSVGYRNTAGVQNFEDLIKRNKLQIGVKPLIKMNKNWGLAFSLDSAIIKVVDSIRNAKPLLMSNFAVSQGYIPYRKSDLIKLYGKNEGEKIVKQRLWHSNTKKGNEYIQEIYGRDINKYSYNATGMYVKYGKHVASFVDPKFFSEKRLLVREITNPGIIACILDQKYINDPQLISIIENTDSNYNLNILWAILNSKLATFYHFNSSPKATKGAFPKILVQDIKEFPIPSTKGDIHEKIEALANSVLKTKQANPQADTSTLEVEIDQLVYALYDLTEEEIAIIEHR